MSIDFKLIRKTTYFELHNVDCYKGVTPPPPPLHLHSIYKINCCTFMFNMSYSRIALKRNNTVITIKRNDNYIAPITKIQNL